MKINEFIKKNLKVTNHSSGPLINHMLTSSRLPKIVCEDGFTMSVQVGYSLYSTPKKVAKRYSAVEIGFPSEPEELIKEYAESLYDEDATDYTDTVYPYVPVAIVDKVLKKHGGINLTQTLLEAE
jgi:hypothetical protein